MRRILESQFGYIEYLFVKVYNRGPTLFAYVKELCMSATHAIQSEPCTTDSRSESRVNFDVSTPHLVVTVAKKVHLAAVNTFWRSLCVSVWDVCDVCDMCDVCLCAFALQRKFHPTLRTVYVLCMRIKRRMSRVSNECKQSTLFANHSTQFCGTK